MTSKSFVVSRNMDYTLFFYKNEKFHLSSEMPVSEVENCWVFSNSLCKGAFAQLREHNPWYPTELLKFLHRPGNRIPFLIAGSQKLARLLSLFSKWTKTKLFEKISKIFMKKLCFGSKITSKFRHSARFAVIIYNGESCRMSKFRWNFGTKTYFFHEHFWDFFKKFVLS